MKTILLIIASMLFSTLFFDQHIGLNLSIFSITSIALLFVFNRSKFLSKHVIVYTLIYTSTAILVFFINSRLSILANCIAFITLVGAVSNTETSIFVSWLNGFYTSIAGFFHRNFDIQDKAASEVQNKQIDAWHLIKLVGIPSVFLIIFALLYQNGNPIFERVLSNINFEFFNFQWLLFCFLGYFLLNNIVKPVLVDSVTTADLSSGNSLKIETINSEEKISKEIQLGNLLIALLNLLILFFLITDVIYLINIDTFDDVSLTEQVHNSVNTLIASIIIAISILLFLFRGDLNFYKKNLVLKKLSYVWIVLNMLLVITIFIKNGNYIFNYGLTYKRIGVYVYLLLTIIGLTTTLLKIMQVKNLWFLFRKNTQAAFAILVISSFIDWDSQITDFNLYRAKHMDMDYLIELSMSNSEQLKLYSLDHTIDQKERRKIDKKYEDFIKGWKNKNWQELTYRYLAFTNDTISQE